MKADLLNTDKASRIAWLSQFSVEPGDLVLCSRHEDDNGTFFACSLFTFLEYKSALTPMRVTRRVGDNVQFVPTKEA